LRGAGKLAENGADFGGPPPMLRGARNTNCDDDPPNCGTSHSMQCLCARTSNGRASCCRLAKLSGSDVSSTPPNQVAAQNTYRKKYQKSGIQKREATHKKTRFTPSWHLLRAGPPDLKTTRVKGLVHTAPLHAAPSEKGGGPKATHASQTSGAGMFRKATQAHILPRALPHGQPPRPAPPTVWYRGRAALGTPPK
jgi:hypothetical protein